MRYLIHSICLASILFSTCANAEIHPVVSVGIGADDTNLSLNKTITILAPFQNTYYENNSDTQTAGTLFVGAEMPLVANIAWQLGVAYNQSTDFVPYGSIDQFANPLFDNLTFNFNIRSQRYLLQSKLLYTFSGYFHPYLIGSVGESVNRSSGYSETGVTSADVGMQLVFANKTYHTFTYAAGLGLDIDVGPHMRFGVGYSYMNLGRAGLGVSPLQDSTDTLKFKNMDTNELQMQLSYIG
jgi:opacity protein-like surface antigen